MKDRKEFYGLMVLEMNNSKTVVLSLIQLTTAQHSKIKSALRTLVRSGLPGNLHQGGGP